MILFLMVPLPAFADSDGYYFAGEGYLTLDLPLGGVVVFRRMGGGKG